MREVLHYVSKKAGQRPLGLLTVAAMLPKGWNKRLVDCNVRVLKDEDIKWADMVFISGMIIQKNNAQEVINRCKGLGKKVVAGGPLFTGMYEKFRGVDHFVLGEAEITLPLFIKDLKKGKGKAIYTSTKRPDITKTPIPMWSLINFNDYMDVAVQYSRGCPFNCEFCDIVVLNGRIPRTKTPEQVINEFQALYDARWRGPVFIVDDNFIRNKVKVKKLLLHLIKWQKEHNYPFTLYTQASVNLADDDELMKLMSEANFINVFLGIETPNIESLKECGKMQNTMTNLLDVVKKIHQYGMTVTGGFIVGFDNDTESVFDAQIEFIQKSSVVTAMIGLLIAIPKTRLWHRLKDEGRLLPDITGDQTDGTTNIIPKMGSEKLINGYKRLISTIYFPDNYYQRIKTFLIDFNPTARSRITKAGLIAFFKSIWTIGILSNARFLYWKLLLKTLLTSRKSVPYVVSFAIAGQSHDKFVKRILAESAHS
jgi:radical SAM superfamily enzyme YgiQ (UPF0313 family)